MLEWLVLIGLVAAVVNLGRRLARAEQQLLELASHGFTPGDAAKMPATGWADGAPAAPEAPAPEQALDLPTPAQPLYGDRPFVPEDAEELVQEPLGDEPGRRRFAIGFEELFGRHLPIWAGGITLAIAGILIVKLSIDSGLLSPPIRVAAGLLFGVILIGGAELARRQEHRVRDPRVRQALSGAGIASLYASILVTTNLYGLIAPLTAMLGMAAVTGLALLLATRFGAPSALLGLAGGLAAPALIGSDDPNVPLLSLYLSLAVGGLCTLSRSQRWMWLGVSALVGGFGWGLLLLLGGALDTPGSISLGLYLLLIGVAIPALGFAGDRAAQLQLLAGIAAAAQMAALVATGGFDLLNWGLFGLLALASQWLASRESGLARLPAVGAAIALLLLGAWPNPSSGAFALVTSGVLLIYGVPAALRLWRAAGGLIEAAQIGALGLGGLLLPMLHFYRLDGSADPMFGAIGLALAAAVAASAVPGLRARQAGADARFAILVTTVALLTAAAATLLLPGWLIGPVVAAVGLAALQIGQRVADRRLEPIAWIFAAAGALAFPYVDSASGTTYTVVADVARWVLLALIAAVFAWRARFAAARALSQFAVPMFVYIGAALIVPDRFESLLPPALLLAAGWAAIRLPSARLAPAMGAALLLIAGWAMLPIAEWSFGAAASLTAMPMMIGDVPDAETAALRLLFPALSIAATLWVARARLRTGEVRAGLGAAILLAAIGAHAMFKQLFALNPNEFVRLGLAERLTWELLLIGGAAIAARFCRRRVALAFAAACAAHLAVYSLLLHNPLWNEQAVGAWPILNLLLPLYALALGLTSAAERWLPMGGAVRRVLGVTQMLLITLFLFSLLRQLFHGSLLVTPGLTSAEDIGRSILAIAIAIGFLLWGIAQRDRDWRIASLVLMLGAVAKVFLFDASGLEGLTRIASFVALGFSLIGIGWLYARHLTLRPSVEAIP